MNKLVKILGMTIGILSIGFLYLVYYGVFNKVNIIESQFGPHNVLLVDYKGKYSSIY